MTRFQRQSFIVCRRRAPHRCTGFTLLEMMVVLAIALSLMIMIVPIFQLSTRTIQTTERKLAVYEAGRNILDYLEALAYQVYMNEKGEHFSIKSCSFQDSDLFTPTQATPDTAPYRFSRREADAMDFSTRAGTLHWTQAWRLVLFAGQQEETTQVWGGDGWFASVRSTYLYQSTLNRNLLKSDLTTTVTNSPTGQPIPLGLHSYFNNRFTRLVSGVTSFNEPVLFFAPGSEKDAPNWGYAPQPPYTTWQRLAAGGAGPVENSRIALLDLDIAYWDQATGTYTNPPDDTVIYFAPPPKSLRFTITVCDHAKRARVTLSRVVVIASGTGKGAVSNLATADPDYLLPAAYNRTKNLTVVDPNTTNMP